MMLQQPNSDFVVDNHTGIRYSRDMKNNNNKPEASKKMYLTAAESKAANLPSMDEQIRRWNELQKQIREGR